MKKLSYFVSLACMLMFASCSSDIDEVAENSSANNIANGEKYTISVGMPGADATRVGFKDALTNMVWEQGDCVNFVTRFTKGKSGGFQEPQKCAIKNGAGTTNANFDVTFAIPQQDETYKYKLVYVGNKVNYQIINRHGMSTDMFQVDYKNQEQLAVNDFSHLKDYIILTTDSLMSEESFKRGVKLAPTNCFFDLNLKDVPAEFKGNNYTIAFKVDLTPIAQVNLKAALTANQDNHIYFAFAPTSALKANSKIFFEISDGTTTKTVSALSENGVKYEAGNLYHVTVDKTAAKTLTWETETLPTDLLVKYPLYTKPLDIPGWKYTLKSNLNVAYTMEDGSPINVLGEQFQNSDISEIVVPAQIKVIPSFCFYNCQKLKNVTLSEGVEEIGSDAFCDSKVNKVIIPATVKIIQGRIFEGVTTLYNLYLKTVPATLLATKYALDNINSLMFKGGSTKNTVLHLDTTAWKDYIKVGPDNKKMNVLQTDPYSEGIVFKDIKNL